MYNIQYNVLRTRTVEATNCGIAKKYLEQKSVDGACLSATVYTCNLYNIMSEVHLYINRKNWKTRLNYEIYSHRNLCVFPHNM